ncbi:hypothetical protein WMY93_018770 [Mugilogobius chulae]|uniref:FYVE, RhoGEF and PH domain containing 4b n=1 Tax=Mugilogobius chulae TaxID=88201 RepID=A0AAW0NKA1_9GOBI
MFELKKRRSLPLTCSGETEEFKRVAVRRKFKGHTDRDVCLSYSSRKTFDRLSRAGPKSKLEPEEDHERSPAKRSLHKPHVPPKPPHLQTPVKSGPQNDHGPKEDQDPNRGLNGFTNPSMNCYSPTPTRGSFSPAKTSQVFPYLTPTSTLGSQASADADIQNSSPKSEGRHTSKSDSPILRPLRTPSPVQGKMWTYTPSKISKSWLGINQLPKLGGQERSRPQSLSVPDLIVYMEENSLYPDKVCYPLQTDNTPDSEVLSQTETDENATHLSRKDSKGKANEQNAINGNYVQTQEAKIPAVTVPKFYCKWTEDVITDNDHKEATEETEKEEDICSSIAPVGPGVLFTSDRRSKSRAFPPEVVKNIFSNISSIFSFHSHFLLPDLEKCITHRSDCPGLGSVLLQHAPFMRMYADYVRNFDQSLDLVRTWTERSSAFRNIIREIQSMEQCGSLTLQHHMLEPVQRLPRYELLLRDYLKKLPEDHPDFQPAQKSLQTISMATVHSNSAIQKAEGMRKLLEVYEMVGEEEVVNPTNELLKEGRLVKLAARNTSAMERRLFLFNNFLLCCSPKFSLVGQRYTVRCRIGVDGMNVQPTTNEGHPFTFQVSGKEKIVELQASSQEERDEWIKVIQEAISIFQKKNETFRMAARELIVEEPMKELGRRAPKWIRDNEVTTCMKCKEPFNPLTRRRHHCRACGFVVCWKCSDNKVALEYDGNKLNKVCKSCFFILTGQRGERPRADSDTPLKPSLMSGFLNYGENPKTRQQTWTVLPKNDPSVLYLYAAPQDMKPQSTIPLLGYKLEKCSEEFQGQVCFCLRQSKITHTFFCDHTDLRERWLSALKTAILNATPALLSTDSCNYVCDASSSCSDDYVIIDNDTQSI